MKTTDAISLKEAWNQFKTDNPKVRIRDAAKQLGASEAQLVATGLGSTVTRLEGDWQQFLKEVLPLGEVLAITRNDDIVHERKGVYDNVSFQGPMGLVVNPDIDLRLFMMNWDSGFFVNENDRLSFQFFDKSGQAVHKIYATDATNLDAFKALAEKFAAANQTTELAVTAYPPAPEEKPDAEIDAKAFQDEWIALTDTHNFFGLLRKYGLTRTQALRLAPEGYVQQVGNNVLRNLLNLASERQVPIMVFVGNRGCIQIHSGTVTKVMEAGPWYNVLDPNFNLHAREEAVASAFLVKKPSEDGTIHSIEIFDKSGEMLVQFFGARKPGIPELESWRTLVNDLINL